MMQTMGYFNRDNNNRSSRDSRGGGRGFSSRGGSSFGRGGDDRPREMFKTVCSNCGKDCEVPFKPTTGKPVYCSDCFETMGGRSADGGRNERPERRDRPSFDRHQTPAPRVDNTKQFEEIGRKLDKVIELLTSKAVEAPVEVPALKKIRVSKVTKKKVVS